MGTNLAKVLCTCVKILIDCGIRTLVPPEAECLVKRQCPIWMALSEVEPVTVLVLLRYLNRDTNA